jgi:hypothetical protein
VKTENLFKSQTLIGIVMIASQVVFLLVILYLDSSYWWVPMIGIAFAVALFIIGESAKREALRFIRGRNY